MPFYTDGTVPWNSLDDNTRAPLASEMESGYPCGPADQELFNWTAGWPIGNIWNVLLSSGLTPDPDKLLDLARAIQSQKMNYQVAGGTGDALTATLTPTPANLTALIGMPIRVMTNAANTGAVTLNVNGLGAKPVVYNDGSAVAAGDFVAGTILSLQYDGTSFKWLAVTAQAVRRLSRKLNRTVISSTGSYSFTVPAGIYTVTIKLWGAGGGGGGANIGTPGGAASGGGGGAYTAITLAVTPGSTITGTIGVGGTGGTTGGVNGTSGGDTTAVYGGTTYTAGGGQFGLAAVAGTGQNSQAGGVATNGDNTSRNGNVSGSGTFSYNGTVSNPQGGNGGASPNGGNGGNGGLGNGNSGQVPGGGGAGAGGLTSSNRIGGDGARGEAWFEY